MHILLSEPDIGFLDRLSSVMKKNGCIVEQAFNDTDCIAFAEFDIYDVIIIDSQTPKSGGLELVKNLRMNKVATPILYFAQSREIDERVSALDFGADDCLCKPFAIAEFLARVRALARRKPMQLQFGTMSFGDIILDLNANELICNEQSIPLSIKEFQIMKLLISSGKNVVSKDNLSDKVWGINSSAEYNNTEVYISFLRKKLKKLNSQVKINTIRSVGYVLSAK